MKTDSKFALTYKYLIVACIAALFISTFFSYFFYNRWEDAEDRSMTMMNEKNTATQNYQQIRSSFDKVFSDLIILRDENATVFTLQSTDSTKRYIARVYWNHYTRQTFLDVLSLPATDSTKQYQLWALVNGQPFNAGVFNVNPDAGVQRMKSVAASDDWAVTIEPKGGSTVPTMEQMCLLSKSGIN